jgi:hypothetical protein
MGIAGMCAGMATLNSPPVDAPLQRPVVLLEHFISNGASRSRTTLTSESVAVFSALLHQCETLKCSAEYQKFIW